MTRGEMLARMPSWELSAWMALYNVKGEEREHDRHKLESGDGIVEVHGGPTNDGDEDDEEGEDDDGGG
jgi:hypothetical protein